MIVAEVSVTLFLAALLLILLVNLIGYGVTRYFFGKQDRLHERVAERAAKRAVELALRSLHGDDDSCGPTHS